MIHKYTLCAVGIKYRGKEFSTRQEANDEMYKLISKNHLHIEEIWDDNHDKTYLCNNNVNFYIQRV